MAHDAALSTGLIPADDAAIGRILDAAESCFQRRGYSATSTREIAEAAGVSKSLLHYHFQSKEHLFLEVLVRIYGRLATRIAEAVEGKGTPAERAVMALDTLFAALRDNPDFQVQARVWAHSLSNASLSAHAVRLREYLRAELLRTMDRVLGPGAEPLPVPREAAADLLWAVVSGLGLQAATDTEAARAEAAFQALRQMFALALGGPVPPPKHKRR